MNAIETMETITYSDLVRNILIIKNRLIIMSSLLLIINQVYLNCQTW